MRRNIRLRHDPDSELLALRKRVAELERRDREWKEATDTAQQLFLQQEGALKRLTESLKEAHSTLADAIGGRLPGNYTTEDGGRLLVGKLRPLEVSLDVESERLVGQLEVRLTRFDERIAYSVNDPSEAKGEASFQDGDNVILQIPFAFDWEKISAEITAREDSTRGSDSGAEGGAGEGQN